MWYARRVKKFEIRFGFGGEFMGKKLGKSVFTTGVAATTLLSGLFSHKARAEEMQQSDTTKTNSTEVVDKPASVDELKQITAQKGQVSKDVQYQAQKVSEAQTEVKTAGRELDEKKTAVTDAENLVVTTSDTQIGNAENGVKVAQAYVTIEEDKVREAENAHAQVLEAVRQQENQVTAQESLVDVAENEWKKAKAPISNDEQVLQQALLEQSQVERSIRESQQYLASIQTSQQEETDLVGHLEGEIQRAQIHLEDLKAVINTKEAELVAIEQAAANSPVQLSQASYESYLQVLANQGNDVAASALALYKRGREEDGITVGESSSLHANLRALEIADAINTYRRNAGLAELEIDPYSLPASQIQLEYFKKANWHMFKYLPNENIAYGFSPAGAVDFWYNEKAAYQEVAAQFDLSIDETQIDANAIYMKIGAEAFAKVGHYLQMMDSKATALSVAYDPSNAMSEAAFIHAPVTSAVTTSALAYRLRQGAGATTTRADVKSKADEVASLKVDKSNQESQILLLEGKLADARHTLANLEVEKGTTQQTIQHYKILLVQKDAAVEKAQATLAVSRNRIESSIQPKEAALQKAKDLLAAAREKLTLLKEEEAQKAQVVQEAHGHLKAAQEKLEDAQKRLSDLQHAPELLMQAQSDLLASVANLENKKDTLEAEFTTLQSYHQTIEQLNSRYEELASRIEPAVLKAADLPSDIRSSNPTTLSDAPTLLPPSDSHSQVQHEVAQTAPKQEAKVEVINPKKANSQAPEGADNSKNVLVATAGVLVGLVAGLFGFKKKKQHTKID